VKEKRKRKTKKKRERKRKGLRGRRKDMADSSSINVRTRGTCMTDSGMQIWLTNWPSDQTNRLL
jgi:hypothetical protein